jgi:hypothetical protein
LGPNILVSSPLSNTLTKIYTHTKQQVKLQFCIFYSFACYTGDGMIKYSEPQGSKHCPNLTRSAIPWKELFLIKRRHKSLPNVTDFVHYIRNVLVPFEAAS